MRWAILLCLLVPVTADAAPKSAHFDTLTYTPPANWTVELHAEAVSLKRIEGDGWCALSIFRSRPAAAADFAGEFAPAWKAAVDRGVVSYVEPPPPKAAKFGSTHVLSGGAMSTISGQPVVVILFLLDGGGQTTSILFAGPNPSVLQPVCDEGIRSLLAGIKLGRSPRSATAAAPP